MRSKAALIIALAAAGFSLSAQSSQTITIEQFREQNEKTSDNIRIGLVRDAAMSVAMRAGLAKQSVAINQMLSRIGGHLDQIYDFNALMLEHGMIPPVIRRLERITEQEGDILRYSNIRFRIVKQAQFTTRPPTWRTYLTIPLWSDNSRIVGDLMPKNSAERKAASDGLKKGWDAGAKQANDMFFKGLTRLENDYLGMATYHALLKSNMVTLPNVLRKDVPVIGDGNTMTIDQSTYSFKMKPAFNPRMMQWVALIDGNSSSSLLSAEEDKIDSKRVDAGVMGFDELRNSWLSD